MIFLERPEQLRRDRYRSIPRDVIGREIFSYPPLFHPANTIREPFGIFSPWQYRSWTDEEMVLAAVGQNYRRLFNTKFIELSGRNAIDMSWEPPE
ncbi:hypothetical protein NPIL_253601 [Nephila pilipes]|uniref:Uncharacterized protein n=1 Tax=Nephila pilipes TaxID=299642 RepID=A0A8X6TY05_NEPPI|nr:hypothetical protein NPIL_253601 [Nephila pilipes]